MTDGRRPRALVTGASGGIGADLARELARDGHDLVLVARGVAAMEALRAELEAAGAAVAVIGADLSVPGAAGELARALHDRGLEVDVLVNNAGFGDSGPFLDIDPAKLDGMLMLNVVALSGLTRAMLPGMVARGRGRVLMVASTAAFQPGPGMAAYCATKAFVLSLGEALAVELAGTGVTVTTLCPGPVRTGFAAAANSGDTALFKGPAARLMVMEPAPVARAGYRALKAGRRVAVVGLGNKVGALAGRFLPRRLTMPLTRAFLSRR